MNARSDVQENGITNTRHSHNDARENGATNARDAHVNASASGAVRAHAYVRIGEQPSGQYVGNPWPHSSLRRQLTLSPLCPHGLSYLQILLHLQQFVY